MKAKSIDVNAAHWLEGKLSESAAFGERRSHDTQYPNNTSELKAFKNAPYLKKIIVTTFDDFV